MEVFIITFYNLFGLIFSTLGKGIAKSIALLSSFIKHFRVFQVSKLEQDYRNNPNEHNRILYENAQLRNELKKYKQAHAINLQKIHRMDKKHSCFCERLRIIIFRLTHNASGKDIEDLFSYSYRTISSWICLFNRFGLLGIFPKGQLPWSSRFKTPVEIVQLVWKMYKDNPSWGSL